MIAQLVRELGFDLAHVVRPTDRVVRDLASQGYGVFHVERAAGSPYIPAQTEFVERYGIRSVLAFGGAPPSGELFAAILFTRVPVPSRAADMFGELAADGGTLLATREREVFDDPARAGPGESRAAGS